MANHEPNLGSRKKPNAGQRSSRSTELEMDQYSEANVDSVQDAERNFADANPPGTPQAKRSNKHRFWMGLTALFMILGLFLFESSGSVSLRDVRSNGIGKGAQAGTILASTDENIGLEPRDYDIQMKSGLTTSRMLIWDFAAEDGDVVTVKVNGSIIAENIMIYNKPIPIEIPIPSVVEIVGIKDGVGGITYGVKFPGAVANNAYFNVAPVGSANTYTITGQ